MLIGLLITLIGIVIWVILGYVAFLFVKGAVDYIARRGRRRPSS